MAYTLFQEPPIWFRDPGAFVGVSFCAAEVNFSGGAHAQPVDPWSFDSSFDMSFG